MSHPAYAAAAAAMPTCHGKQEAGTCTVSVHPVQHSWMTNQKTWLDGDQRRLPVSQLCQSN